MAKYMNPYRALKNKGYRNFWIVQSISLIGSWVDTTLRGWVAVNLFSEDKAAGFIGLIAFLKGFPSVFFSPIAGVFIDWFGAKSILFMTQLVDAINAFIMAFLVWKGILSPVQLMFLSLLMGVTSGFYLPSRNNFIAGIVNRDLLPNSLALHAMIFNVARMIGPTLAGFIVESYGLEFGFLVNVISFVPLLMVLPFIKEDFQKSAERKSFGNFFSDLKEGFYYTFNNATLRNTLLSLSIYSVFGMPFGQLMQAFVKNVMHSDITGYSFIMGAMGVGAFIGANLVSMLPPEKLITLHEEYLLLINGISITLASIFPNFTLVASLIIGAAQSSFFNITNSRTQLTSPNNMRGRTMAVYSFVNNGGSPIGSFALGLLSNAIGTRVSYLLSGLIIVAFCIWKMMPVIQNIVSKQSKS